MTDPVEPQADRPTTCHLCGEEVADPDALEAHMLEAHGQEDEGDIRWWHWLLAIPLLLWEGRRVVLGLLFVVAVALAAFGAFDKEKVKDSRSCPGYQLVRDLKAKGQINSFVSVEPEDGWDCEYSLDNEDAEVRFRTQGGEVEMEVEGRSTPAYYAASREARADGYKTR